MEAHEQGIPKGAKRLSDLSAEKDVDAALAAWRAGASLTLVEAVGGAEAVQAVEQEKERASG